MRFALVNSERSEARPALAGSCPCCSQRMVAKCGTQRVWHWAHCGNRNCDPWWEPETLWHLSWKNQFPSEWQEIIRHDERGEKHVADVMTENSLVIEFQHSHLPLQEKVAREGFYQSMVWVVDGTRLKGDHPRFLGGRRLFRSTHMNGVFTVADPKNCFPSGWLSCGVPVFFDFEHTVTSTDTSTAKTELLWCLLPGRAEGCAVVVAVSPVTFVKAALKWTWIIPVRAVMQTVAATLRREREIAEREARSSIYDRPQYRRRRSRSFRNFRRRPRF
ncbi:MULTISPECIES: competence protein CoiA family protein [unclassified Mesorhizobium]|uniref:competence protein CoiA n=1 Tax=unclassified Mesorhizobium TaxID=325217 RepID=UPI000FCB1FCF|nr:MULTISPECIES: competence protein CoiA family protein [unclassified Mesorhizobium]RUW44740.1 competence protein [Mesorhizobium sp. M8A.F.Ca.ET.021.01.1.1]TGT87179.1 competence protein [Mesorhizobium sp. M8A.F.Ca.ET.161.01.1.1]TGV41045.1 competence protein [Mesorhizobium sp. M8A.F.Ca.ET.142.01.1.1]